MATRITQSQVNSLKKQAEAINRTFQSVKGSMTQSDIDRASSGITTATQGVKDLRVGQALATGDTKSLSQAMSAGGRAPTISSSIIGTGKFDVPEPINTTDASNALGGAVGVGVSQTGTPTYGETATGGAATTTGTKGTTDAGAKYDIGTTTGAKGGDLISQIQSDIEALRGKPERQAELDKLYKTELLQKELDSIREEKMMRDRYYENQLRDMQDRGGGLEMGLQGEMDTLSRNRNRELADISIREAVALQDFNTATAIVDKKLAAEFEPLQNEITNLTNLYNLMQNDMSESEQLQAQAVINDKASSKTYAMNSASAAYEMLFNSGAVTPDRLNIISNGIKASTDAISAGKSPMQGVNMIYSALDGVISPTQKSMMLQEASLAWDKEKYYAGLAQDALKATKETLKAEAEAMKNAKGTLVMEQKKSDLAGLLIDENGNAIHDGMKGTVGAYGVARWTPFTVDKGAQKEFIGIVDQLTNGMTFSELMEAKANGATFGALSEGELRLLSDTATKINNWRLEDKNTKKTIGYEIDEASFLRELKTIQTLSDEAVRRTQQSLLSPDELGALEVMTSGSSSSTSTVIDGSNYYY